MLTQQKIDIIKKYIDFSNIEEHRFETEEDEKLEYSDLVKKLCSYKNLIGLSWDDVADAATEFLGLPWKEGYYRRNYGEYALTGPSKDEMEEVENGYTPSNEIEDKILELRKERVKISDERIQNNAYIRRMAREDTIKEIAFKCADKMSSKKLLDVPREIIDTSDGKNAILCLSDWHYGIEINNIFNHYNPEICKERVIKLRDKVIKYGVNNKVSTLYVLNLADMIAGRIHLQLRLESRFDVITQTMEVSEIMGELLSTLSQYFHIEYYSCLDNHSRLEPNKKEAMDLESLCRITDWYLLERLKDNKNIHINTNECHEDIITFKCGKYNIMAVHGDKDKKNQLERLQLMVGLKPDVLYIAHLHHFWLDTQNKCKIIGNGALMGSDEYSLSLRLTSAPSQTLTIVGEDNATEILYNIEV